MHAVHSVPVAAAAPTPSRYEAVKDGLGRLGGEGDEHAWRAFAALARDPDLPEHAFAAVSPSIVRSRERLAAALSAAPRASKALPSGGVDALWRYAEGLDPEGRLALDVLLRRAVDPFEALATFPLEAVFEEGEARAIRETPRPRHRVRLPVAPWRKGSDMSYEGTITVIAKMTRLCNLRCVYCNDWRAEKDQVMGFDVQLCLARELFCPEEHAAALVIWHGGEPTLLGRRGCLRFLMLERWFQRPGQHITNEMQTNGTRIDEAWAAFFERYRFGVGVSLDGPEHIHDATRPDAGGHGSYDKALRGLRLLRERGLLGGVAIVVGEAAMRMGPAAFAEFLEAEGLTSVALLPVRPAAGRRSLLDNSLSVSRYYEFLLALEARRVERGGAGPRVREIETVRRLLAGESPRHCEMLGGCVGAFFSVEPDGTVAHCDKYLGDPLYTFGNVTQRSFAELRAGERCACVRAEARAGQAECDGCEYFDLCRGWCPHEHYAAKQFGRAWHVDQCGLRRFFAALEPSVAYQRAGE